MNTSRFPRMSVAACVSLFIVPAFTGDVAKASDDCPVTMKSCPSGTYQHIAKSDVCEPTSGPPTAGPGKRGSCRPNSLPPDDAELMCMPEYPRTMNCQVWPQGPGFTYHFATQGAVTALINGSTPFPYQSFTCRNAWSSGLMHVTITAPSGTSSSVSIPVSCSDTSWIE